MLYINPNILIVEDESLIAMDIEILLKQKFQAITKIAESYDEVVEILKEFKPDIVLMDIKIYGKYSGIYTAKEIKKKFDIPIIFLTSYSDNSLLSQAFKTNPDNYLTKPFKEEDLISSIKLSLYKFKQKFSILQLDNDFYFDFKTKELHNQDKIIPLSNKEKKLLELFIKNRDKIITFDTVDYEIWEHGYTSKNNKRNLILRLRKKLDNRFIKTIFGVGYKFDTKTI